MTLAVVSLLGLTCIGVLAWTASAPSPSPALVAMPTGVAATAEALTQLLPGPPLNSWQCPSQRRRRHRPRHLHANVAAVALAPRSPKAACAGTNVFSHAICMSRECQAPRWNAHPECAESRAIEAERQRRIDQR